MNHDWCREELEDILLGVVVLVLFQLDAVDEIDPQRHLIVKAVTYQQTRRDEGLRDAVLLQFLHLLQLVHHRSQDKEGS